MQQRSLNQSSKQMPAKRRIRVRHDCYDFISTVAFYVDIRGLQNSGANSTSKLHCALIPQGSNDEDQSLSHTSSE